MKNCNFLGKLLSAFAVFLSFVAGMPVFAQSGHVLPGVGAINQSVAGTSTAMPLDASGALYWNPASITDLDSSQTQFNAEVMFIDLKMNSSAAANAFGAGAPPAAMDDTTKSKMNVIPLPGFAYVHKGDNDKWATGFSTNIVSGFGVNYPQSTTNPILTPQPPLGYGFGEIKTQYNLIQIAPACAYKVTDNFSVGLAPILDIASLKSDPFPASVPDDANGDGFATYPNSGTAWAVGSGFQLGAYYKRSGVHAGVSLKSPQWFQNFHFKSQDELGNGRNINFKLNFPLILSMGVGYSGIPKVKLMADTKYIDYSHTSGFRNGGFDPVNGAVNGYGWKSIWAFSTGAEYEISDNLKFRSGYLYNQNPISKDDLFFSIGAPGIIQNHFTTGFTYKISDRFDASLAYVLGLKNSTEGPFQSRVGPIANTSVKDSMGTQSVAFTLRYML